jgi:predicted DNA-binding antitoxin AbrB/MazE fold protein
MTARIQAVYEKGVFRPASPVSLAEGSTVELIVNSEPNSISLLTALKEIADLPQEGPDDGFSGADHDRVLYPERDGE